MNRIARIFVLVVASGAAACAGTPRAADPLPRLPSAWSADGAQGLAPGGAVAARWWETFHDDVLTDLVGRATAGNPGLAAAAARVREARALAKAAGADRLPSADARSSSSRTRRSETTEGGAVGQRTVDFLDAGFDVSWEIDVWGRVASSERAALADADASVADRAAVLVSLRAEVVRAYASLRGAQRLRGVLSTSAAAAAATAGLTRSRVEGGLATDFDAARAEAQSAAVAAEVPSADETIEREIHRLSILCGEEPGALAAILSVPGALPASPPSVVLGTPADTLARRPDLRRAALRSAAEEARAGAARADLYPRLSLGAALGFESEDAADLLNAPSRAFTLTRAVTWPVFDGGRRRANVDVADARLDAARADERAAVLEALREVEDAVSAYVRGWQRRVALSTSVEARRQAVSLAKDRHQAGLADFLDVLDAERSLYDADAELARAETDTATRLVQLWKALGAGGDEAPLAAEVCAAR